MMHSTTISNFLYGRTTSATSRPKSENTFQLHLFAWSASKVLVKIKPTNNNTLPETNIAPETLGLEDEVPFGAGPIFRGFCC